MAIVSTLIGAGAAAKKFDVFDKVGSIFGGRKGCTSDDYENRKRIADLISDRLTRQEMRELTNIAKSSFPATPIEMAKFYLGGSDCFHRNVNSDDKRFLSQLENVLKSKPVVSKSSTGVRSTVIDKKTFGAPSGGIDKNDLITWGALGLVALFVGISAFK